MPLIHKRKPPGKKLISKFLVNPGISLLICLAFVLSIQAQTAAPAASLTAEQLTARGLDFSKAKDYDKAIELFKEAININPKLASAYHGLGSAYVNMGRVSEALEPMKTATQLDPDNSLFHLNLAIAYSDLRQGNAALAELNTAKKLNPNDTRIYVQIGNVLHNNFGRVQDALAMYLEARRLNPDSPAIYHNIGLMYMRLGKFSEAIEPLEEALKLDPKFQNARYILSDAYNKVGRYNDSAESWSKFLLIVPKGPEALMKGAWNYMYAGEHGAEAAADARAFINAYGWTPATSSYMAILANIGYRQAGNNKEAKAVIREAAENYKPTAWQYNIIRYFNNEIRADELMNAAIDNDKKTEAHTYLGMDALLRENKAEAKAHFEWVKAYGNQRFFEYPLAIEELKRLSK